MRIHLIRHGMTIANERRLYCGFTDVPLSERGISELIGIRAAGGRPIAQKMITSGMTRAIQTMEILCGRQPDYNMAELKEMNFGDFEMKGYDELRVKPEFVRWLNGGESEPCPGGESIELFRKRVLRGFEEIVKSGIDSAIVVCHGGVIVTIMDKLFPDQRNFYGWQPENGKGYTVVYRENRAALWTEQH